MISNRLIKLVQNHMVPGSNFPSRQFLPGDSGRHSANFAARAPSRTAQSAEFRGYRPWHPACVSGLAGLRQEGGVPATWQEAMQPSSM
jgi:hypothetical protein